VISVQRLGTPASLILLGLGSGVGGGSSVPNAPTSVMAVAGNGQATVSFASGGGTGITGYTVTSIPAGGTDVSAGALTTSHVVGGLVNGTTYSFRVVAINATGSSAPSIQSNAVTPAAGIVVSSSWTPVASTTTSWTPV
jgi:hypothetical protein